MKAYKITQKEYRQSSVSIYHYVVSQNVKVVADNYPNAIKIEFLYDVKILNGFDEPKAIKP